MDRLARYEVGPVIGRGVISDFDDTVVPHGDESPASAARPCLGPEGLRG